MLVLPELRFYFLPEIAVDLVEVLFGGAANQVDAVFVLVQLVDEVVLLLVHFENELIIYIYS